MRFSQLLGCLGAGLGLQQACGLPRLHAGTPVLTSTVAGPRYLMSRPGSWRTGHTHLAGLCATMATAPLADRTKAAWSTRVWPSHLPALQLSWPSSHGSMLCGGRLAQGPARYGQGTCGLSSGEHHVLWQGPERGLEIKGHKPTWGVLAEVGSAGAHKSRPARDTGKSCLEDLGGPAYLWEVHSHS